MTDRNILTNPLSKKLAVACIGGNFPHVTIHFATEGEAQAAQAYLLDLPAERVDEPECLRGGGVVTDAGMALIRERAAEPRADPVEVRARANFNLAHGINEGAWDSFAEVNKGPWRDAARRQLDAENRTGDSHG